MNSCLDTIMGDSGYDSDGEDVDMSRAERNNTSPKSHRLLPTGSTLYGLDDGAVVHELVESFLVNVHIKNPILNPSELRTRAGDLIENGLSWDAKTCQVVSALFLSPGSR